MAATIIWSLRLPMTLMGALVGIALGVAGLQMQTILDNMNDGVILLDADFNFVFGNEQFMDKLKVPPGVAVAGKSVEDIIRYQAARGDFGPTDDVERTVKEIQEMRRQAASSIVLPGQGGGVRQWRFHRGCLDQRQRRGGDVDHARRRRLQQFVQPAPCVGAVRAHGRRAPTRDRAHHGICAGLHCRTSHPVDRATVIFIDDRG